MNLIDPFQFREMFHDARSYAIVGNAPTILENDNGAKIDSHDVVVRFNRATTASVENKIGSRTDILVVNASNSRAMAPSPAETLKPRCLVCYVSPQGVRNMDSTAFAEWVEDVPLLLTFGPDLIDLPSRHHTRPLTSGTYFLMTLLRMLDVEKLFITGFTMFGATGGASTKYYADNRPGVGVYHDLDVEAEVFASLLTTSDLACEMTADVAQVVNAVRPTANVGGDLSTHSDRGNVTALRRRVAGSLAWRIVGLGIRLRRYAESR
jgi:Glycosyltransferase family 29 (sialyltransferase)